jgi:DNA-binding transcriptional ArsR family regulator
VDGTLLGRIHDLAVTGDRPWNAEGIEVTGVEAEALIAAYVEEDDILRAGSVAIRRPVQPLLQNADLGPSLAEDDSRGEVQPTRIGGSQRRPVASLWLTCDRIVTYKECVEDDTVFKALADATRRHLLDRLFERDGRTLTELESELAMTRFGVMKHLRVLEGAGLVVTRRSGREKLHFLNPVPIRLIHDRWIDKYTEPHVSALAALKKRLEESA